MKHKRQMQTKYKINKLIKTLVFLAVLLSFPQRILAGSNNESLFVKPSFETILKILVRFNAIDLRKDDILDAYAMMTECDLYKHFYDDDFKWKKFREAFRKSIAQNIKSYPTGIYYDAELQLDRYDFKKGIFGFRRKSSLEGVNYFTIVTAKENQCGSKANEIFPTEYKIFIDQPISLEGIPMAEEDAKTLLSRMKEAGNNDRIIFARFNFSVIYIARLSQDLKGKREERAMPLSQGSGRVVRIDSRLASVDMYEDKEKTRLIYSYRPY